MRFTKSFAAIAAASALLVLTATPAAAAVYSFGVTTGTLTNTVLGTVILAGSGTPPCTNLSTDTDTITISDNGTGGTVVTAVNITTSLGTSPSYMVAITKHTGSNAGTINTTTLAVAQDLSLKVVFNRAVNTSGTCVVDTANTPPNPICTVQLNFNTTAATQLVGSISNYPPTSATTLSLSGTGKFSMIIPQTCSSPFATVLTAPHNLATMTVAALI